MKKTLLNKIEIADHQVLFVDVEVHGIGVVAVVLVNPEGLIVAQGTYMSEREAKTAVLNRIAAIKAGNYNLLNKVS